MPWWVKDYADGWIKYETQAEAWASEEAQNGATVLRGPERPVTLGTGESAVYGVRGDAETKLGIMEGEDYPSRPPDVTVVDVWARIEALEDRVRKLEGKVSDEAVARAFKQPSHGYPKDSSPGGIPGMSDWW